MNNMKNKRKETNLSQTEVAEKVGVTQSAYSNYEIGKRQPKPLMLKKIASVLDCTVDELLEEPSEEA